MTIADMKAGSILLLGIEKTGEHIEWLKTGTDSLFIKRYVSEGLVYDTREPGSENSFSRVHGNSNFYLSTAYQYLNSVGSKYQYCSHEHHKTVSSSPDVGFLSCFTKNELEIIDGGVRLPKEDEVFGENKFQIFEKKLPRARSSFSTGYEPWCTMSVNEGEFLTCVTKSGYSFSVRPAASTMMRPVISIKDTTEVKKLERGIFCPILQTERETDISQYLILK